MKRFMHWGTLFLAAACLFAAAGNVWAQGSRYSDVDPWDWYRETVDLATDRGIVSGYPDGSFRPDQEISYGEFLAMCLFADELQPPVRNGHWAQIYYNTALAKGYMTTADFTVRQLDDPIPRKHMALLLAGLAEKHGLAEESERAENQTRESERAFRDVPQEEAWADSILCCAELGLLSGYPDGSFRPSGRLKRSEATAAVMNYADLLDKTLGDGNQVVLLYDSGNYIVREKDGQFRLTDGASLFTPVSGPDKQENIHPAHLMRQDHKAILDELVAATKIQKENGAYTFTYAQPEIGDDMHLAVDLHIYKDNSQGGSDAVFYYNSDAGWMSDPGRCSGQARTVSLRISENKLTDKAIVLRYLISDLEDPLSLKLGECAEYCFFVEHGKTTLYTRASRYHNGALTKYEITEDMVSCPVLIQ